MNPTPEQLDSILELLSQKGICDFDFVLTELRLTKEVLATSCIILEHDRYIKEFRIEEIPTPIQIHLTKNKCCWSIQIKSNYRKSFNSIKRHSINVPTHRHITIEKPTISSQ